MKKYKVTFYTTCNDLRPQCVVDEFMLEEIVKYRSDDHQFIQIEDDSQERGYIVQLSQLIGIAWEDIEVME